MDTATIRALVQAIPDPEIPVLTLGDLGVIRGVCQDDNGVEVSVSPTYSGCPATAMINELIQEKLNSQGIAQVNIKTLLFPPWSSDWISESGRVKLKEYGIAPPNFAEKGKPRSCPHCDALEVEKLSEFGSTPCQALWKCLSCQEVFSYFKCI